MQMSCSLQSMSRIYEAARALQREGAWPRILHTEDSDKSRSWLSRIAAALLSETHFREFWACNQEADRKLYTLVRFAIYSKLVDPGTTDATTFSQSLGTARWLHETTERGQKKKARYFPQYTSKAIDIDIDVSNEGQISVSLSKIPSASDENSTVPAKNENIQEVVGKCFFDSTEEAVEGVLITPTSLQRSRPCLQSEEMTVELNEVFPTQSEESVGFVSSKEEYSFHRAPSGTKRSAHVPLKVHEAISNIMQHVQNRTRNVVFSPLMGLPSYRDTILSHHQALDLRVKAEGRLQVMKCTTSRSKQAAQKSTAMRRAKYPPLPSHLNVVHSAASSGAPKSQYFMADEDGALSTPMKRPPSLDNGNVIYEAVRTCIPIFVAEQGLHAIEFSAVDILADLLKAFLRNLVGNMRQYADYMGRAPDAPLTAQTVLDVCAMSLNLPNRELSRFLAIRQMTRSRLQTVQQHLIDKQNFLQRKAMPKSKKKTPTTAKPASNSTPPSAKAGPAAAKPGSASSSKSKAGGAAASAKAKGQEAKSNRPSASKSKSAGAAPKAGTAAAAGVSKKKSAATKPAAPSKKKKGKTVGIPGKTQEEVRRMQAEALATNLPRTDGSFHRANLSRSEQPSQSAMQAITSLMSQGIQRPPNTSSSGSRK